MHIHFGDDDGEAMDLQQERLHTNALATTSGPQSLNHWYLASSVRTDYSSQDQCYVFDLAAASGSNLIAASLSNNLIKLYSVQGGKVSFVRDLAKHRKAVNCLTFPFESSPHQLYSCSSDGTVLGWDARTGTTTETYSAGSRELYSCSVSDNVVVAGSDGVLLFWDRRKQQLCGCFEDTHAQDITQVHFHPIFKSKLLSASTDGLIAVFDVAAGLNEDDGFQAAYNVANSVAKINFFGPQGELLWCTTHTESFYLWEWAAACSDSLEGGDGPLAECDDMRGQLSSALQASPSGTSLDSQVDYLLDCHYNAGTDQLHLLAGNNSGAVGFFPLAHLQALRSGAPPVQGPCSAMQGGHNDTVRSVVWYQTQGVCCSAGDDGLICCWQRT